MYSGTKIEMYNGGTFTEQPFTNEQRVHRRSWKECAQCWHVPGSVLNSTLILELKYKSLFFPEHCNSKV